MSAYLLPCLIALLFLCALCKRVDIQHSFSQGVKDGVQTVLSLFPLLILILVSVRMLQASGLLTLIQSVFAPVFSAVGIPAETIPVLLLRPFSGSGALGALDHLLSVYGADTFAANVAAVLCAATETTFYTLGVYLGKKSGKTGRLLLCAVLADLTAFLLAPVFVRLFL